MIPFKDSCHVYLHGRRAHCSSGGAWLPNTTCLVKMPPKRGSMADWYDELSSSDSSVSSRAAKNKIVDKLRRCEMLTNSIIGIHSLDLCPEVVGDR